MKILTRKKEAEIDALVEQLRQFNQIGAVLIVQLQGIVASLEARIAALEAFQSTLQTPGDMRGDN